MKFLKLILLFAFLSCASFAQDKKAIVYDWFQIYETDGVTFDASYQAVLDRGTALGYTLPSPAQQVKQNQLVVSLKAAGIWTLLDVFYVFATDGDSDFATLNWINPALYQCSKVNSPVFTTNQGFNGNGSTSYLNTNWNPSANGVNWQAGNAGFFGDSQIVVGNFSSQYLFGCGLNETGTQNATRINPGNVTPSMTVVINGGLQSSINTPTVNDVGFYSANKDNLGVNLYINKNGLLAASDLDGIIGNSPPFNMYILAYNENNIAKYFRAARTGIFGAGASLQSKDASLYSIYNNYLLSL